MRFGAASGPTLRDAGTYIAVTHPTPVGDVVLHLFPFSANRIRLGEAAGTSWNGLQESSRTRVVPGARLAFVRSDLFAWVAGETAAAQRQGPDYTVEQGTVWGLMGGAAYSPLEGLWLDGAGAYFDRGTVDRMDLPPATAWHAGGLALRAAYSSLTAAHPSARFRWLDEDPLYCDGLFTSVRRVEPFAWEASGELIWLSQPLQDASEPTRLRAQDALGGEVGGALYGAGFSAAVTFRARDWTYILFDVPSLTLFVTLPNGITGAPELAGRLALAYTFEAFPLQLGAVVEAVRPAFVTGSVDTPSGVFQATLVIPSASELQILDPGGDVAVMADGKLQALLQIGEHLAGALELLFIYDENRRRAGQDPTGLVVWQPEEPFSLGFNLVLRARL